MERTRGQEIGHRVGVDDILADNRGLYGRRDTAGWRCNYR